MTRKQGTYEAFQESSVDARRLLRQEELILDVTERLHAVLAERQVSRAELAQRLGRSKAFISQLLAGDRNLTLRTISDLSDALEVSPVIVFEGSRLDAAAHERALAREFRQCIPWNRESQPWLAELILVPGDAIEAKLAKQGKLEVA